MKFGDRLKELRLETEITQEELAKIIRSSKANISRYEKGIHEPNLETLLLLSDYFDCSVDFLMGKSNVKKPETPNENLQEYEVIIEKAKGSHISPKLLEKLIKQYKSLIDNE